MKLNFTLKISFLLFLSFFVKAVFAQQSDITKKNNSHKPYQAKSIQNKNNDGKETNKKKYSVKSPRKEASKTPSIKAGIPTTERKRKSADQNVGTGNTDIIVNEQWNDAQYAVTTPKKNKNKKKLRKKKSKEQNVGTGNTDIIVNEQWNDAQYAVSTPEKKVDTKRIAKEKSAQSQSPGQESINKKYNVNGPRKEVVELEHKKVDLSPQQKQAKSGETGGYTGDDNPREKYGSIDQGTQSSGNESQVIKSYVNDAVTQYNGDDNPRERYGKNDFTQQVVGEEKVHSTKMSKAKKSYEQSTSSGDATPKERFQISPAGTAITQALKTPSKEAIKQKSYEQSTSSGDLAPKEKYQDRQVGFAITQAQNREIIKTRIKENSLVQTQSEGDLIQSEQFQSNDASFAIPKGYKVFKTKNQIKENSIEQSTSTGDLEQKEQIQENSQSTYIVNPVKPHITKEEIKLRSNEQVTSQGDVDESILFSRGFTMSEIGIAAGSYDGEISYSELDRIKNKRKESAKEIASNRGDMDNALVNQKAKEKENAIKVREYSGIINAKVLSDRKNLMKQKQQEIASNMGDMNNALVNQKAKEKENAIKVREYKGTYDDDILAERKNLMKEKQKQIAENTGDIISNYIDKRNKLKESNHKVDNYRGKIDYNELKKQKDKWIALDKELNSYTGDILTVSLEKKKATLKEKSRKATWYEGDMIVTKRLKSNHPSAAYVSARGSKSFAEKERLRKQNIKNAKRHREREDPSYMKKETPKPRYDPREYEIWDFDTRSDMPVEDIQK